MTQHWEINTCESKGKKKFAKQYLYIVRHALVCSSSFQSCLFPFFKKKKYWSYPPKLISSLLWWFITHWDKVYKALSTVAYGVYSQMFVIFYCSFPTSKIIRALSGTIYVTCGEMPGSDRRCVSFVLPWPCGQCEDQAGQVAGSRQVEAGPILLSLSRSHP